MEGTVRVAVVLRYYPTLSETFVRTELEALRDAGVDVVVIAMGTRADGVWVPPVEGIPVVRVPRRLRVSRLAWGLPRIDRFHAHFDGEASALARALARRFRVPYSVTVHGVDLVKPHPGIVARLRDARPVITICAHHRAWLANRYGIRAAVLRCRVALPRWQADPARQPARVVAVAREVPKKDLPRLRRACRGVSLTIHRSTPHREVLEDLLHAQLFALPCRVAPDGDRDGIPVSMMEAMAAGLPVVTRPVAGIPELVDEEVGWVTDRFEDALAEALASPAERSRRGAAARRRIVREGWNLEGAEPLLALWGRVRV